MVAAMAVYSDFFAYKSGVYKRTPGAQLRGYHAVSVIGYNDELEAWICKNSRGTAWGDNGFFMIGYGEADMDTKFAFHGVDVDCRRPGPDDDEDPAGSTWRSCGACCSSHVGTPGSAVGCATTFCGRQAGGRRAPPRACGSSVRCTTSCGAPRTTTSRSVEHSDAVARDEPRGGNHVRRDGIPRATR